MKVSVIITTYNKTEWLRKVLTGFSAQTETDFEIVIADDGSAPATKAIIDGFADKFRHKIVHVWQTDEGFQKSKILNRAILESKSDYLLLTDGDCIPRQDFVGEHLSQKQKGYFLSGGYFKLPDSVSNAISEQDILTQNCFEVSWLRSKGLKLNFKLTKLTHSRIFARIMNWITPTKRSWNGHNSSGFKEDILAVNGFNHDMKYGGLDRELGERLFNFGMKSKQIRYSAICLHLNHSRDYSSPDTWQRNNAIREFNKKNNVIRIENGIDSL